MSDDDVLCLARTKISNALDRMWNRAPSLREDVTVYRFTRRQDVYDSQPSKSTKSFTLNKNPNFIPMFADKKCCLMSLTIPAVTPVLVDATFRELTEVIVPRGTKFHYEHDEDNLGFAMRKHVEARESRPENDSHDFVLAADTQHFEWSKNEVDFVNLYSERPHVSMMIEEYQYHAPESQSPPFDFSENMDSEQLEQFFKGI
ncbi:hypothetical protein SARC_03820 [Sphaeroforma arctica JP610]|uniref:Uncharacterized protein n=1 Tax=Sphaeroforma arctica JP610 TaxID=667725 RepID=A0A0L0G557_9EUKA|nr:hypothetical protein SARC_03820 [Sphaeroforma arctica JP610]KNC83956.1 hypothetical protein SARC_03820 [Sphaeroforma arctica JP610]|eukprot:XP_014157858.1 hypothetical protein SARC_03820 [Sphaeroforma arctica JP610]